MLFANIIIFTCVWWVLFYMILPFGNVVSKKSNNGHAESAPTNPRIGIKACLTTIIAFFITFISRKLFSF